MRDWLRRSGLAGLVMALVLVLVLVLEAGPVWAYVSFGERVALVDLFTSTRGPAAWLRTDGWLIGDPCETNVPWWGVRCSLDNSTIR